MPELPEVETVRRGLAPVMEGARIAAIEARRPDLRFLLPECFAERLAGRRVVSVGRRAKYLVIHLDTDPVLICHLGMSGSFRIESEGPTQRPGAFHHPRGERRAHDHVVFTLEAGDGTRHLVIFNDPRRFGFMAFSDATLLDQHPFLAGLGVEPTGNALDGALLARLLAGRKTSLKAALLDQRMIAGLGNIYVCEALWRAGLSPRRQAASLGRSARPGGRAEKLADAIRVVIAQAIAAGGSSLRDHRQTDGSLGYFQHSFNVYDREDEPCRKTGCDGTVKRIVQNGRSTFHCPACQR